LIFPHSLHAGRIVVKELVHDHQDIVGWIILKLILEMSRNGMDWNYLAQYRFWWKAVVYM
jgi:hypothetical protein